MEQQLLAEVRIDADFAWQSCLVVLRTVTVAQQLTLLTLRMSMSTTTYSSKLQPNEPDIHCHQNMNSITSEDRNNLSKTSDQSHVKSNDIHSKIVERTRMQHSPIKDLNITQNQLNTMRKSMGSNAVLTDPVTPYPSLDLDGNISNHPESQQYEEKEPESEIFDEFPNNDSLHSIETLSESAKYQLYKLQHEISDVINDDEVMNEFRANQSRQSQNINATVVKQNSVSKFETFDRNENKLSLHKSAIIYQDSNIKGTINKQLQHNYEQPVANRNWISETPEEELMHNHKIKNGSSSYAQDLHRLLDDKHCKSISETPQQGGDKSLDDNHSKGVSQQLKQGDDKYVTKKQFGAGILVFESMSPARFCADDYK